jgi:hypothetical protein
MRFVPSMRVPVQADFPPVGLLEAMTVPAAPTVTQRLLVGQDTLVKHGDHPDTAAPQSEPRTVVTIQFAAVAFGDAVATAAVGDAGGVPTVGVGGGVGEAIATLDGVALVWSGAEALPQAVRIRTAARTPAFM